MERSRGMRPVVTLWETYGSGATAVGQAVAARLGVPFLAQHLSSAELEAGHGQEALADSLLTRALNTLGRATVGGDIGRYTGLARTQEVSRQVSELRAAVSDGAVVLGRNATVILADLPEGLHVKLDGPLEQRIARGAAQAGIDLSVARSRQAHEDQVRAELSLRYHNWDPRHNDRFDLVINTGLLSLELAVELILESHRLKSETST